MMLWPHSIAMSPSDITFDQEMVLSFEGRKNLSWSGDLNLIEAEKSTEAKS
jgi:hypothetical protein